MEQIRSLLLALQPGTGQGLAGQQPGPPPSQFDDALSLAASANLFNEVMTEGDAFHTLDEASCSSAQGSLQGAADTSMAAVLRTALARLQLDAAQTESAQASAFFRRNPVPATFSVPPSEEYLKCRVTDDLLSCHLNTLVAYEDLSGLHNSPRMAFGPPNAYLPGSYVPHNPTEPEKRGQLCVKEKRKTREKTQSETCEKGKRVGALTQWRSGAKWLNEGELRRLTACLSSGELLRGSASACSTLIHRATFRFFRGLKSLRFRTTSCCKRWRANYPD
ncbi:unnamed protein product [Gadus morhua 'NCC']